jgi:hypothetical protein
MKPQLYAHITRTETSTTVTASTFSTSSTAQVVPITGSKTTILAAHYVALFLKQHDVPDLAHFYLSRCVDYAAAYESIVHCVEIYEAHGKNNLRPISDVVQFVYNWTNDTLTELVQNCFYLETSGENQS